MKWTFPSNNYGDTNGISLPGLETFQGTPLKSLAREICQNSLDASQDNKQVKIEFIPFELPAEKFPDLNTLKEAFKLSKIFWDVQSNKKTVDFCNRGLRTMNKSSISFLRISDFNTSGLTGSDAEYNTPWFNLTKSSGASDKGGTSGGSFGIGKFAPFVCSDIRTVFYNTNDESDKVAYQGVSRITSFKREDSDDVTVGVGYYGEDKNRPVNRQLNLDPMFSRKTQQKGTDIYIAGFRYIDMDWKTDVIVSIIDGFLHAIYQGKLEVQVDDVVINKKTLPTLLDDYSESITEYARNYYYVLTSKETKWYEMNYKNHGLVKLGLVIKPDMHRKVAMIRKTGMKIMDRGNISGIIPFAGVMLIEGDGVNNYLRNLENPEHTKWQPERMDPKRRVPEARLYIKGLIDYIKECLEDLKGAASAEEIDPSVGEYLPDETDTDEAEGKGNSESLPDKIKNIEKRKVSPKTSISNNPGGSQEAAEEDEDDTSSTTEEDKEGAGHGEGSGKGNRNGNGDNDGKGTGGNKKETKRRAVKIECESIRTLCLNKDKGEYLVLIQPKKSFPEGYADIYLSAETRKYKADIKAANEIGNNNLSIENNRIKGLSFKKGNANKIKIKIDYSDYCSMEVHTYGYQV